ncbi:MAG: hypothetical protein GOV02_03685 [Candidatus Aenigmarchaeota archaeon]|nr:hypothetical protein [Candidatus Aenigmarchaeota archaeon]
MMENKCNVCNCDYNIMKQLVKLNQFLWNVEGYIKDAKAEGHDDCVATFEEMKSDALKNSEKLKNIITNICKAYKL